MFPCRPDYIMNLTSVANRATMLIMSQRTDLTERVFGRLTVLRYAYTKNGRAFWTCHCRCGREVEICTSNLITGHTQSCGCYQVDQATAAQLKHGGSITHPSEYYTWCQMIARCINPKHVAFKHYGARGIQICGRWNDELGFEHFLQDMGPRPENHWLERINNQGHYEPGNCKWATIHEQMRNTRRNHLLTFASKTQCLQDWAEEYNIRPVTLLSRIQSGWSIERALTEPVKSR